MTCGSPNATRTYRPSESWKPLDPHGVSINRLAACFHLTRQTLSNLFNGHTALSADMAIRFEKAFGVKADTLMRMQTTYDMALARARADNIVIDRFLAVV